MELEKTISTTELNTALATLAQEKRFGREKTYSIEARLFALQDIYSDTAIRQALNDLLTKKNNLNAALHAALIALQQLFETPQTPTRSKQDTSELQLENKAAKLFSQWESEHTAAIEQEFIALLESEKESCGCDKAGWYSIELLARITLQHADHSAARSYALQALHLAQDLGDLEKTEKSEFVYACAHSRATTDAALRDTFVNARNAVIAETSLLNVDQQHLVMIYSVRDFERRAMSTSALWIMQLCSELEEQMLAPTRLAYWRESAAILLSSGDMAAASEALKNAVNLEKQLNPPEPVIPQEDKSALLLRLKSWLTT